MYVYIETGGIDSSMIPKRVDGMQLSLSNQFCSNIIYSGVLVN